MGDATRSGAEAQIEELTREQQEALDALVQAFGIQHGELAVRVKVYKGSWREALINPERRVLRKAQTGKSLVPVE